MKLLPLIATALMLISASAGAQEAMKPCKPARQASRSSEPTDQQQPNAQTATGTPAQEDARQMANSAACENSPPDTR